MKNSELKIENILFKSSYQQQPVAAYIFSNPNIEPCAILQISHGMTEYILRYQDFAAFLVSHGFIVCGNDHLGHGATSGATYQDGFFAPSNGQDYVLADLLQMNHLVRKQYPKLPLILFGHSMGSFFARWFVERHPDAIDGCIICGTSGSNPIGGVGVLLTALLSKTKGVTATSKLIDKLAFGAYNKHVPNCKTKYDWLSIEENNVQSYMADPKCGFPFTVSAMHSLMVVLQHVNSKRWYQALYKDIPLFIIAGREDPVGNYGVGPAEVVTRLQDVGVQDVSLQIYDNMRHEILNETNATMVYQDILNWCHRVLFQL